MKKFKGISGFYVGGNTGESYSSVHPFYFPFSLEEYVQYYNALADSVNVPVIIYNIPAMSGITFKTADIERFFENEKIIGMKHTSYDLFQLERVIKKYPEKSVVAYKISDLQYKSFTQIVFAKSTA